MDILEITKKIKNISKQSDESFEKLLLSLKDEQLEPKKDFEIEIYKQIIASKENTINNLLKIFEDNYKIIKEPENKPNIFRTFSK